MEPTVENASCSDPEILPVAAEVSRGVTRLLMEHDIASVTELTLPDGRRADVVGLGANGAITIVEIKSSVADFRSDAKWHDYLAYCDRLFFAVPPTFPTDILPTTAGLIVADRYGGAFLRETAPQSLAAGRRKTMMLRFARTAAARLAQRCDPALIVPNAVL